MTTWDSSFEATPADTDEAKYGANEIRTLKTAISERLDTELNFKVGGQPLLKAGIAAVCFYGNQTQIANLANDANSNVANGALAYDSENFVLQQYWGGAWANIVIYHNQLGNLTSGDPHTQYLKLDKADQTITANVAVNAGVTIGGVDLSNLSSNFTDHANANITAAHSGGVFGTIVSRANATNHTASTDGLAFALGHATYVAILIGGAIKAWSGNAVSAANEGRFVITPVKSGEVYYFTANCSSCWFAPIGT